MDGPSSADKLTRLHTLWDTLADSSPDRALEARQVLLAELCKVLDADNAMWAGVVRLSQATKQDPLGGWRMPVITYLHPLPRIDETVREYKQSLDEAPDAKSVRYHAEGGSFRVRRLIDLVDDPDWFESDFYLRFFKEGMNATDVLFVGAPVNEDCEAGLAFYRKEERFTPADCAVAERALRGLRWFFRQQLLGEGLLVADAPLTPLEQRVLGLVLQGKSTKLIAAELEHSANTTNEYLHRLYRKYGVTSRAELMAIWLGRPRGRETTAR